MPYPRNGVPFTLVVSRLWDHCITNALLAFDPSSGPVCTVQFFLKKIRLFFIIYGSGVGVTMSVCLRVRKGHLIHLC